MPSSVLLAILVGAGVLALMPALVRRYDTAVRGEVELQTSSMRVLLRRRRRRTVPGPVPINPPSALFGDRIVGVAPVADALTPGDSDSDALVREALARRAAQSPAQTASSAARVSVRAGTVNGPTQGSGTVGAPTRSATVAASARAGSAVRADAVRREASRATSRAGSHPVQRSRPGQAILDGSHLREWQRFRRRRVLLAFTLLTLGQAMGVAIVGSGFWAGLAVSGVLTLGYLARLRAAAAIERRQAEAERARRQRAYEFVRVATRDLRVEHGAAARTADWLATPRESRRRPTREVIRVLALAGREVARAADGTWTVRKAVAPAPASRRPVVKRSAVNRPAAQVASAAVDEVEEALPRAVNL